MTLNQIGKLQENLLALIRLELAPRPFECLACRGDRAVDVFGVALRHRGEQFAGRGIAAFEVLAGSGVHPFAVDEHLFVGAVRIWMAAHWNGFSLGHAVFSSIAVATRFTSAKAYFREIHRYISENITTMSEKRQKGGALHLEKIDRRTRQQAAIRRAVRSIRH
jgi:hypothetical protein